MSDSPAEVPAETLDCDSGAISSIKNKSSSTKPIRLDIGAAAKLARSIAAARDASKNRQCSVASSRVTKKAESPKDVITLDDSETETIHPSNDNDNDDDDDLSTESEDGDLPPKKASPSSTSTFVYGCEDSTSPSEAEDSEFEQDSTEDLAPSLSRVSARRKTLNRIRLEKAVQRADKDNQDSGGKSSPFPTKDVTPMKKGAGRPSTLAMPVVIKIEDPSPDAILKKASPLSSPSDSTVVQTTSSPSGDDISDDDDTGEYFFGMDDAAEYSLRQPSVEDGVSGISNETSPEPDNHVVQEAVSPGKGDAMQEELDGSDAISCNEETTLLASGDILIEEDESVPKKQESITEPTNLKDKLPPPEEEISIAGLPLPSPDREEGPSLMEDTATAADEEPTAAGIDDGYSPKMPPTVKTVVAESGSREVLAPFMEIDGKEPQDGIYPSKKETDTSSDSIVASLRVDMLGESSFGQILSFLTPFEGFAFGTSLNGCTPNRALPKTQLSESLIVKCPKQLRPSLLVAARAFRSRPKAPCPDKLPKIGPSLAESLLDAGICLRIRAIGKGRSLEALEDSQSIVTTSVPLMAANTHSFGDNNDAAMGLAGGYKRFVHERYPQVKEDNPTMSLKETIVKLGAAWCDLTESEQDHYKQRSG